MAEGSRCRWQVGDRLGPLRVPAISRALLTDFALASGDPNPLHLDPVVARVSGHQDVIAHGMLSMAYAGRLLTECFGQGQLRSWQVRFVTPTPVGTSPLCQGEIVAVGDETLDVDVWVETAARLTTLRGQAVVARPS